MRAEPLISVTGLSHTFGGGVPRTVLRDVSLDFYPGETVIIMGPSGSGKTTLLTLAGALRSPQSGSIRVGGIELRGASGAAQHAVRQRIGFVFQSHNLLRSLTACENVQMGLAHRDDLSAAESRSRAMAMLARVGLDAWADAFPAKMSGGQCQRVAIARALVRDPAIVMADEPTAALDKQTGREIVDLLQELARTIPCAVLLVTHDSRILDVADRILMLDDGTIEESHRGLDRIVEELAALLQMLARYPSAFGANANADTVRRLTAWHEQFSARQPDVHLAAASFVARRLNDKLARQADFVQRASETLRRLEEGLLEFGRQMTGQLTGLSGTLADSFLQSLDFVMTTAAAAMASRQPDDIALLATITEGGGVSLETLGGWYFDARDTHVSGEREYLLNLSNLYARLAHDLHGLAGILGAAGARSASE